MTAPYGGGSSSSAKARATTAKDLRDQRAGGKACDWFIGGDTPGAKAPEGWDRTKGIGMDGWFAANCISAGELK